MARRGQAPRQAKCTHCCHNDCCHCNGTELLAPTRAEGGTERIYTDTQQKKQTFVLKTLKLRVSCVILLRDLKASSLQFGASGPESNWLTGWVSGWREAMCHGTLMAEILIRRNVNSP